MKGEAASGGSASPPGRYARFSRRQWIGAGILAVAVLVALAAVVVLSARAVVALEPVRDFLERFPGSYALPEGSPEGTPAWLGWQHFLNAFFVTLILRTGWQVRGERHPPAVWTSRRNRRRRMGLTTWGHLAVDALWIVNGVVFVVLLFATGRWVKIVPTSWEVLPNALSAALQYLTLDWPTHDGWVTYNSLQQLFYFATVFLAAPLAILTGVRLSAFWPRRSERLNRLLPYPLVRRAHIAVMVYFVVFVVVHVGLVFATGALRNLNHMYAARDAENWIGFWVFAASVLVLAAGWIAMRPAVLAPLARLFGDVKQR